VSKGRGRSLRRTKTMRGRAGPGTLRTLGAHHKTPAGTAFAVSAPSEQAFRANVEAGICPFCGLGPYKALAIHTGKAHAVDRFQLREMAGLPYSASITSPEYHAERVALSKKQFEEGVTLRPEHMEAGRRKKRKLSPAAIEMQRQKAQRSRELHPDSQRRATEASVAATAERMRPEYERVVEVYEQVVAERGMAYGSVTETARRLGLDKGTTLTRLNAAEKLGIGTARTKRGSEEQRTCPQCGQEFTVTRTSGWNKIACSRSCASTLTQAHKKKPPQVGTCMICDTQFSYSRNGIKERKLCDSDDCRREVSRRAGQRRPSEETRRKISEARRRKL
jgi:hypothetical protein